MFGALDAVEAGGLGGYAMAVFVGAIVGGCCVWGMWKLARRVGARIQHLKPQSLQKWCLGALYLSTFVWMALAAGAAYVLTRVVIRYFPS